MYFQIVSDLGVNGRPLTFAECEAELQRIAPGLGVYTVLGKLLMNYGERKVGRFPSDAMVEVFPWVGCRPIFVMASPGDPPVTSEEAAAPSPPTCSTQYEQPADPPGVGEEQKTTMKITLSQLCAVLGVPEPRPWTLPCETIMRAAVQMRTLGLEVQGVPTRALVELWRAESAHYATEHPPEEREARANTLTAGMYRQWWLERTAQDDSKLEAQMDERLLDVARRNRRYAGVMPWRAPESATVATQEAAVVEGEHDKLPPRATFQDGTPISQITDDRDARDVGADAPL